MAHFVANRCHTPYREALLDEGLSRSKALGGLRRLNCVLLRVPVCNAIENVSQQNKTANPTESDLPPGYPRPSAKWVLGYPKRPVWIMLNAGGFWRVRALSPVIWQILKGLWSGSS